eukprot:Nk52_evm29s248 gene=Nk52_evmTU29s248
MSSLASSVSKITLQSLRRDGFALWKGWMNQAVANDLMARSVKEIPFAPKRWTDGHLLPQLAYNYEEKDRETNYNVFLEETIIPMMQNSFDVEITDVWCNLFENGKHRITWHQDQYGTDVFVLSFGSARPIEFRTLYMRKKTSHLIENGDLYYFSQKYDKKNEHCVPEVKSCNEPRVSLVMFAIPKGSSSNSEEQ